MLCVIARIDDSARVRLARLCKIVEEFDIPARYFYGHITLVSYVGQDETNFVEHCKAALTGWQAFPVYYSRLEHLVPTSIIVASPDMTQELTSIHDRLLSVAPSKMDSWSSKELWHPHTTLFYHTEADLQPILERMQESFEPFSASVASIEFSRVSDKGYEIIGAITLSDAV